MFRHARIPAAALTATALGALGVGTPGALAATRTSSPSGATSGGAALTPTTNGITAGASATAGASGTAGASSSNPLVQPGNVTVSDSGAGFTLSTTASALLRKGETFSGTAPVSDAGKTVEIERLGHETNWTWEPTVTATVDSSGRFSATWSTNHIGEFEMRAVMANTSQTADTAAGAAAGSANATVQITVYRPSVATWYGPGFFGQQTACGEKLTRRTLGVANRTLKCGENVALYYRGKTLVVPVIDRGPYANGADWDLTQATSRALGIQDTVTLGAVSLPAPPASAGLS